MKVVINRCYGGYGLSKEAVMRYAELAGITLYHDRDGFCDHYYKVPVAEYNRLYEEALQIRDLSKLDGLYFSDTEIDRTDPLLVQIVEELGEQSWGEFSELSVVTIPDGVQWEINDYDGMESVHEVHRTWR